jgi:hypothetical protein
MANSYHTYQLESFGLIDEIVNPEETMYSRVPTTSAEASVRQPLTPQEDPTGQPFFAGYESTVTFRSAGVEDFSAAEAAMAARRGVKMVGIAGDFWIHFHNDTKIQAAEQLEMTSPALSEGEYMLQAQGGGRIRPEKSGNAHSAILTRNLLAVVNEETDGGQFQSVPGGTLAGGWDDTQGGSQDQVPDGFTSSNFKNTNFDRTAGEAGQFQGTVDTASASDASLSLTSYIPLPLQGATFTFSVEFESLHDNGTNEFGIEVWGSGKNIQITSEYQTVTSTGRKSITVTTATATDVGYVQVTPVRVTGATTETTAVKILDPCLRPGTADTYVPK